MAFTKTSMQEQLLRFIQGYASSVDRVLSTRISDEMEDVTRAQATTLWRVSEMFYDYGVDGIPIEGLGAGYTIDAELADVELFLNHIESLDPYLYEDDVQLPYLARRAARTAAARHVLEGGERYTYEIEDAIGYLGLAEVALLANMDEKSVRNAANTKNPDPLRTETVGKRSMVSIEEARRWLVGRKGFVPTKSGTPSERAVTAMTALELPSSTVEHLRAKATEAGVSVQEYIQKYLG